MGSDLKFGAIGERPVLLGAALSFLALDLISLSGSWFSIEQRILVRAVK